ncbi:MAG: SRPBCC family protein [Saprospiraceae bacterium]|uniref:SRPBCC family protein n=1 Tax=Candidatus Opimibacter skivensis TaxID=2982028 RepID=A0A9D7XSG2_9BACT|nr:SRPBCC family protein [Candidatus Opimibacter skivensis]
MTTLKQNITVQTTIDAPVEKVWKKWTTPSDIMEWNNASDDWHTPHVENNMQVGEKFLARMEAKDGSFGFDFEGTYEVIIPNKKIIYVLADGRRVDITFESKGLQTLVTETFDAEDENTLELQRTGWQAILDNFKKHTEK